MSDVSAWSGFAYMDGDPDGVHDENRKLADWQVQDFVRWAMFRGYDTINLTRLKDEPVRFEKQRVDDRRVRHHFHGASVVPLRGGDASAARSSDDPDVA